MQPIKEAGAFTRAAERAGNMLIQLITPGQGSSGSYSAEVLQEAAQSRTFPAGTLMFADHPGEAEAYDRPERSIRDVAGVLIEDARWDGAALVAEARTYEPWTKVLGEMADAIGVSIRATADVAEGVVTRLDRGISVDFVTQAGRGGKIREVYESARKDAPLLVLDEARTEPTPEAGEAHTTGDTTDATEASPKPPVTPAGSTKETHESEEDTMQQIEESRLAQLEADAGRVQTLESERDAATAERDTERAAHAATRNRAAAIEAIADSGHDFTALERRGLLADIPVVAESGEFDAEAFTTALTEAAADSRSAGVTGFGSTTDTSTNYVAEADTAVANAFGRTTKEA